MKSYYDIVGDGGSNILEQVTEKQQRIADNLSGVRHLVAVGSGKGGVGKSTLTTMLAHALAAEGKQVAILDVDLNGPTQARLAGLPVAPPMPGERGLALPRSRAGIGVVSLGAMIPESEALEFDSVASGESHTWRATREFTLLADLLEAVEWGKLDYLLLDLPPGAERTFQFAEFFDSRTAFVLVTLTSELARGVVSRSRAALRKTPNRVLGLIENMAGYHCGGCDEVRPLFPRGDLAELDLPVLGSVPFEPEFAARCDRGEQLPGPADGATFQAVRRIARRIDDAMETT